MFRKLVANLSYSPSLVGELGAYDHRLKQEVFLRKIGLITALVSVIIQVLISLAPPESANSASNTDLIYGGISSSTELLKSYDANTQNLRDAYSSIGITRKDLESLRKETIYSKSNLYIVSKTPLFSYRDGVRAYSYTKVAGGQGTVYFTPFTLYDHDRFSQLYGTAHSALVGSSGEVGEFAVLTGSGNLVVRDLPSPLQSDSSIQYSKTAFNATQVQSAAQVVAQASDRIVYEITAKNTGAQSAELALADQLGDVLEYATVIDTGGGALDTTTGTLTWPSITLSPGQHVSKRFTIRIATHVPATARGMGNAASYDCWLTNSLGNTVNIPVACPAAKNIETIANQLPRTPASAGFASSLAVAGIALFFYARSRQQREELRLIRHDFNTGALS